MPLAVLVAAVAAAAAPSAPKPPQPAFVLAGGGCAVYGGQFGLTGVVYGAGLGWLIVTMAATSMAHTCVRACAKDSGPAAAGAVASVD